MSGKKYLVIFSLFFAYANFFPSHAQSVSTRDIDNDSIPNGAVIDVFSKMLLSMSQKDSVRYESFVENFLGFTESEGILLLGVSTEFVESSKDYFQSELQRRCEDGAFTRTREGNSTELLLLELEAFRQDTYARQESDFIYLVQDILGSASSEVVLEWVLGEFKSNLTASTIDESYAVNRGLLDIDLKLDRLCLN